MIRDIERSIRMLKKRFTKKSKNTLKTFESVYAGPYILVPTTVMPYSLVIGRSPDCDIVLKHDSISRRHCEIKQSTEEREYLIRDLSSRNGTYVNEKRIGTDWVGIIPGATLRLGNHKYSFEMISSSMEELWLFEGR